MLVVDFVFLDPLDGDNRTDDVPATKCSVYTRLPDHENPVAISGSILEGALKAERLCIALFQ